MQTLIFNLTDHHAFISPFDKSAISERLHARNAKREAQIGKVIGACMRQ